MEKITEYSSFLLLILPLVSPTTKQGTIWTIKGTQRLIMMQKMHQPTCKLTLSKFLLQQQIYLLYTFLLQHTHKILFRLVVLLHRRYQQFKWLSIPKLVQPQRLLQDRTTITNTIQCQQQFQITLQEHCSQLQCNGRGMEIQIQTIL